MQLLQLIIFKEEEQEIGKPSFNYKQLQLSQYMSTLCWIVLIMTVKRKWSFCLKDLKLLFTKRIK